MDEKVSQIFSSFRNLNKEDKFFHGFTLIELLVVISMIGVMISFLLIFINPFKQIQKAKDAQRQADLSNIKQALDTYYNDNNCFPVSLPFGSAWQVGSTVYMKKVPQDPDCSRGGSCYQYLEDTASCPQWNILFSKAAVSSNATSCPLQQIPSCTPTNYFQSGYSSCIISGDVDCPTLTAMSIPTSGGSQTIPTITTAPTSPPMPTSTPTQIPAPTSGNTPTPTVIASTSTPTPTTSAFRSVRVSSIAALKIALADNTVDEIVVVNGTYHVSTAGSQASDSLWIGSQFAGRTRPVIVRAETTGRVIFDGGGAKYFGGISFEDGAHHQEWRGFVFANGEATNTGVITFGGWVGNAAAHHITLRNITLAKSLTSHTPTGVSNDHGIYISQALGGVHDCLIDGLTVYGKVAGEGSGGLDSAIHFYHSSSGNPNATNFTIRNVNITGTDQAIIVWDGTVQNILIQDTTITNATDVAVRYEQGGTLTLRRVNSTGSGLGKGFYSSLGTNPPEVTFDSCSLH